MMERVGSRVNAPIRIVWRVEPQNVPPQDVDSVKAAVQDWVYANEGTWPPGTEPSGYVQAAGIEVLTTVQVLRDHLGPYAAIVTCVLSMAINFVWDAVPPEGTPREIWNQATLSFEDYVRVNAAQWPAGAKVLSIFEQAWVFLFDFTWSPDGEHAVATVNSAQAAPEEIQPLWSPEVFNPQVPADLHAEIMTEADSWMREHVAGWDVGQTYEGDIDVAGVAIRVSVACEQGAQFYIRVGRVRSVTIVDI